MQNRDLLLATMVGFVVLACANTAASAGAGTDSGASDGLISEGLSDAGCGAPWDGKSACCCASGAHFQPECSNGTWQCPVGTKPYGTDHCNAMDEGLCYPSNVAVDVGDSGAELPPAKCPDAPAVACCCGGGVNVQPKCMYNQALICTVENTKLYAGDACSSGPCAQSTPVDAAGD